MSCSDTPAFFSVPTPRTSWGWILVQVSLLGGGDDFSVYSFFFLLLNLGSDAVYLAAFPTATF